VAAFAFGIGQSELPIGDRTPIPTMPIPRDHSPIPDVADPGDRDPDPDYADPGDRDPDPDYADPGDRDPDPLGSLPQMNTKNLQKFTEKSCQKC
jgi:hypothetical protein